MKRLLCKIGLHIPISSATYLPDIDAKVITDVIYHSECVMCGKVMGHTHLVWNGDDMVEKDGHTEMYNQR